MILSDRDLRRLLKNGKMKIAPLDDEQIGPSSIDLTLSNEWQFFKKSLRKKTVDLAEVPFQEAFEMKKSKSIILKPRQMCLAKTKERITLPSNVIGNLEGRSRYARMGIIIHITSALVQPGSDNHQVLEIVNLAPFSVRLHEGMRISQVVFQRLETSTSKPYAKYGKIAREQ